MVNFIILYKKFVEHHVIKLILLKIFKLSAHLTQAIIRDKFTTVKTDKTDINLKPGVYRIPCTCGKVYIGETGRNLKVRQKEHKDCCLKCQPDKSALAKHALENDHPIKWDDSELLVPVRTQVSSARANLNIVIN